MTSSRETTPGRSLATYFALTFILAWALWLLAAALTATALPMGLRGLFFLPGTFAPAIVALWMTSRSEGRAGLDALLGRVFVWDVNARWYVFAVGYMAAVKLAAAVAHRAITGAWPSFGDAPVYLLLAAVLFSTPVQAGEEIGWRGYALPRMSAQLGLARASVLLGAIWAAWHLPLFFIPATTTTGQSFEVYFVSVTALSVAMAWLHAHTKGSLLLVMIMHAAVNNTKDIVPSAVTDGTGVLAGASLVAWLTAALLWGGAAYFLMRMPRLGLAPPDPVGAQARV